MNDKPDHRTNKKDKSKMQDWDGLRGALTARVFDAVDGLSAA